MPINEQDMSRMSAFLYTPAAMHCPVAEFGEKGYYSYKLNRSVRKDDSIGIDFTKRVILFDGICNSSPFSRNPKQDIARRHLGGANVLLEDGRVILVRDPATVF